MPFYACKKFCPILNLLRHSCVKNNWSEGISDIGICPVFNLHAENEGERGDNKMGANIYLYTVNDRKPKYFLQSHIPK